MYKRKRISIMLIVILLFQIVLPMVATTKVIANEEVSKDEQLVNELHTNMETNLKTIKFGSYSNESVEEKSEEIVKETSTVLENSDNISEAYLEWSELSDEEKKDTVEPRKEYIDISELQTNEQFVTSGSTIPEEYNLRDTLSEIKTESQGSNGNCYAYAGLNAIETNIALKTGTIYDFSEMHIEYMTSTLLGGSRNFNAGGNFQTVVKYSDDLQGPVLESEIANRSYSEEEYTLLKNAKPIVSITETIEFPTINKRYGYTEEELTEFRESVKSHIMENGSVYASIYFSESSNYYNRTTKGYSCLDTSVLTNHAVSIIGWDDSYSKENFPTANRPTKDGAWVALNSHGSSFGNNGVFYISYEDNWVEYNMSGVVSTTSFVDTYGPKVELTNYTNENNTISATINVFDIGGSGVNNSSLKYQWTQSSEQPTLESFTTSFTNGDTLSKTYAEGEQWYLWILAYDTENNYSISGAVQELKFTDENFYNALCYVLSDRIISSKVNEDSTYSIFMTQDSIESITSLSLRGSFDYPTSHVSEHINNIEGIKQFINLKELAVTSHNITSIENISFPSGLEYLSLAMGKLESINNVVLPSSLKIFDLHQNFNLTEINIELPESLEELNLHGLSALKNWESINFPNNLKKLNLASCNLGYKIENLNLPITLTELLIGDNGITNIDCLSKLINLEDLCVGANNISDISVIEKFSRLESFTAGDTYLISIDVGYFGKTTNQISQIDNIDFPDTIRWLDLGYNKIDNASSVNWPTCLEVLYLDNNLIENISLEMGQNFKYLDLNYNKIKDVSKINISDRYFYGRQIVLSNNEIQSIPENWGQSKINTLILSNNNISNIDNIVWPNGLDSLAIDGNNITELNGATWKEDLRYLILNDNNISEIKNITWPESLRALELVGNNITDLSWIESGTNLIGVALNDNNICNLESLSVLSKLQELHLDNNYIEDISPLENLSNLSSLSIKKQYISKMIENNESTIKLPQIIKSSTITGSKVYSENTMTQKNCNISGENIVFDINELGNIYIMINGGNADGTIVYITDSVDNQLIKSVYKVKTKEDLIKIRDNIVNNGFYDLSNSVIELENDIDLGGTYNETTQEWKGDTWIPLGTKDYPFAGEFEGNGYKITGLYINSDTDYQGLIGYNIGTIQNLTVQGYITTTGNYVGGICGYNKGIDLNNIAIIKNCKNKVEISAKNNVGGICGDSVFFALIENCSNNANIVGYSYVGGICGENSVGRTNGKVIINNCYNSGNVSGNNKVGGICGDNCADMNGTTDRCEISNCYNSGSIDGYSSVGGLLGISEGGRSYIENCYNSGKLTGGYDYANLVGEVKKGASYSDDFGIIKDCYYLIQNDIKAINYRKNGYKVFSCDDEANNVYGLTDEYMKSKQFVDLLNSTNEEIFWKIGDSNYQYPMLAWQEYTGEVVPEEELAEISITTVPNKTEYIEGQTFDKAGMVVTARYNDGTSKTVTNYTVTPNGALTTSNNKVIISYTENGVTKTVDQAITVVAKQLTGIEITTTPTKTSYIEGQTFDKAGIVVTATYNDGSSREVTNYTINPSGALTTSDNKVTISYTENGVTKTAEQTITVTVKAEPEPDKLLGDANRDGKVDFKDILAINKHRLNKVQLTGERLEAADVNKDGKVDFKDILKINKYRLGKISEL